MIVFGALLTVTWIISIVATVVWGMPWWGLLPLGMLCGLAAGDTHRILRNRRRRKGRGDDDT